MRKVTGRLLFHFALEMVVYAVLLVVYFLAVLRFLGEPLSRLFHLNPPVYAFAALFIIVVQAVVLESITSLMIRLLRLEKVE